MVVSLWDPTGVTDRSVAATVVQPITLDQGIARQDDAGAIIPRSRDHAPI